VHHLLMASLEYDVWRRGGMARTRELLSDGHTSHELTRAVRSGVLTRARQGRYCLPDMPLDHVQALRVGGLLTGVAAAKHYGIWTPRGERNLPVLVQPHARALRTMDDATRRLSDEKEPSATHVRWAPSAATGTSTRASALDCVLEIARTEDLRLAFAAAESALHLGHFSRATWQRAVLKYGRPRELLTCGSASESGCESLIHFFLLRRGIPFAQQVTIARVGRVDFLVGDALILEGDGAAFHTDAAAFEEDRRRDAAASIANYNTLRFSANQIELRWPEVERAIEAAVERGELWRK
jgi:very-short-patch-repair endonuclease